MLGENRNGRTVSENPFDRNDERENVALALVLEVTEARADDAETASHVARLAASLERLGIDLAEVARLKAAGLLRTADVKARQIRTDSEDRARRVLREADARLDFVDHAREVLAFVERFFETPQPVDETRSTITPVPMRELPAIHWHPAGQTNTAISPSDSHAPSHVGPHALLAAGHHDVPTISIPTIEAFELDTGDDDVATSDEVTTTEAPSHARVATTPVRRRRVLRRSLGILSVVCILLAGVVVLPGVFETTDDASAPARTPSTAPLTPLASIDVPRFLEHWTQDFASLAPPGLVVSEATVTESAAEATTNEFDALATALATDRVGGSAGIFVRKGRGAPASGSRSESRAAASVSSYASSEAAAAAYDAARAYYIGDPQTAAGNIPIKLGPNVAVRSFGYRHTVQGTRTLSAYLEFPGVLVQLTTSGSVDELTGMTAVVEDWAAQ